jgi:hypothetical protein
LAISRLRAGLAITFAALCLMAGAQAAYGQQTCAEPKLGDIAARGEAKKLVRFKVTGLTPGSEYLVKVASRERKSGVATGSEVSRRFRMPSLGQDRLRVLVEVVVANDACENSPWKLSEKITYVPPPAPAPTAQPPAKQPSPTPAPTPQANPSPAPPAPSPPPAPSITKPSPSPQPPIPGPQKQSPQLPVPSVSEPAKDTRTWLTPLDNYQKGDNKPVKLNKSILARTDQPSDVANSTAALIGLAGIFLLLAGTGAIAWTRFRRFDDQRLDEIMNPEGNLPTHLDPKAGDMVVAAAGGKTRWFRRFWRKPKVAAPVAQGAAAGAAAGATATGAAVAGAAASKQPRGRRAKKKAQAELEARIAAGRGKGKGVLAHLSDEERAKMSDEEVAELKEKLQRERRAAQRGRRKAPLPNFDPTDPKAVAAAAAAAAKAAEAPTSETDNGKPPPAVVPPPGATPHANGAAHTNGTPKPAALPPAKPAPPPGRPAKGRPLDRRSYRKEVEGELQRILNDAGLHAEVDGILADAKAEAQRQGVPIDSELMLRALSEETNGAAKLSASAKEELESRFKRIVAEERGEHHPRG